MLCILQFLKLRVFGIFGWDAMMGEVVKNVEALQYHMKLRQTRDAEALAAKPARVRWCLVNE